MMTDERFIRNLDNPAIWWTFHLRDNEQFTGRLIQYLMDSYGTPITLMVKKHTDQIVEIPWHAVQYIERVPTQTPSRTTSIV